jgi:hypothetical protein
MVVYCRGTVAQLCELHAQFETRTSQVILDWNMISHPNKTTYQLLRSIDGKIWREVVTDKILQHYTSEDIFDYEDKVDRDKRYYYRLRILDSNNKTITFSNIVAIQSGSAKSSWVIYPNPVNEVLTLIYKGNTIVRGVINVIVKDATGKIVIGYRAASIYKTLHIPVSKLRTGIYVVQISILNEVVMNQKFVKQ